MTGWGTNPTLSALLIDLSDVVWKVAGVLGIEPRSEGPQPPMLSITPHALVLPEPPPCFIAEGPVMVEQEGPFVLA